MILWTQGGRWKSTASFWIVVVLVSCGTQSFCPPAACQCLPRATALKAASPSTWVTGRVPVLGGFTLVSASVQAQPSSSRARATAASTHLFGKQNPSCASDVEDKQEVPASQSCEYASQPVKANQPVYSDVKSGGGSAYHLLWSPGFLSKMLVATPLVVVAKLVLGRYSSAFASLPCHSTALVQNWALPLLASSCCLLQLALNVLSVGCAGFNTYLGPVRPYFFSLFAVLQADAALRTGFMALRGQSSMAMILRRTGWSLAQVGMALLPEAVDLFNRWRHHRETSADVTSDASMTLRATIQLEVPTMGCVACINSIDAALNRQTISSRRARVLTASSALHPLGKKGGSAAVEAVAESEAALAELVSSLVGATEAVGFGGAYVTSIHKRDLPRDSSGQKTEL